MKFLCTILALSLLISVVVCPLAWAAFKLPPQSSCQGDPGNTSASNVSCTVATTTSDLIVATAFIFLASPGTLTFSDTCGTTFTQVDNFASLGGTIVSFYGLAICTNATNSVQIAWTGGAVTFNYIAVGDYSGSAQTMVLDDHHAATGSTNTCLTSNLTTSLLGDLLFGTCVTTVTAPTAGTNYIAEQTGVNVTALMEDQIAGVAGSYAATANISVSTSWGFATMAFKPSPSGTTLLGASKWFGPTNLVRFPAQIFAAESCTQPAVASALAKVTEDGAVVLVPAGTCTWTSGVNVPSFSTTLKGAGAGQTIITVNIPGGTAIGPTNSPPHFLRITGFTWTAQSVGTCGVVCSNGGTGTTFRLDHNTFNNNTASTALRYLFVNAPCTGQGCLVDHNTITDVGASVNAEVAGDNQAGCGGSADNCAGLTQWQQTMFFDNGTTQVYFEDNTFTFDAAFQNNDMMDCSNGGRYVFRFNTVTGNDAFNHGYDSVAESCIELTAYQNNMNTSTQAMILFRGGTGVVYQNILINASQGNFLVTNYRSNNSGTNDIHPPFCGAVPNNPIDGNVTNGYPCYEQIGRGSDPTSTGLKSFPLYEWDNCKTALGCTGTSDQNLITVFNNLGGSIDFTTQHIVQNRDFYDSVSPFNGTTGVGIGTLANRPATCTAGVAYWATDQSKLYQCGSGNAWSVYYTQFVHPHPLVIP